MNRKKCRCAKMKSIFLEMKREMFSVSYKKNSRLKEMKK